MKIDLELIKQQNEKAITTLHNLCLNPNSFTMRVPADEERDTDLIIAKALRNADVLIERLQILTTSLKDTATKLELMNVNDSTSKAANVINNGYIEIMIDSTKRILSIIEGSDYVYQEILTKDGLIKSQATLRHELTEEEIPPHKP